jgi:hypothetical protein
MQDKDQALQTVTSIIKPQSKSGIPFTNGAIIWGLLEFQINAKTSEITLGRISKRCGITNRIPSRRSSFCTMIGLEGKSTLKLTRIMPKHIYDQLCSWL